MGLTDFNFYIYRDKVFNKYNYFLYRYKNILNKYKRWLFLENIHINTDQMGLTDTNFGNCVWKVFNKYNYFLYRYKNILNKYKRWLFLEKHLYRHRRNENDEDLFLYL